MTLNPVFLSSLSLVLVAFAAAFMVALWLALIIWTYRDIRRRAKDPLLRILAVLVVAVLYLPGVLIYLILRPQQTLDEEYQRSLEEETLLQSLEDASLCPGCTRRVHEDWIACPTCHTLLKKKCLECGRLMELSWNLCPYCGHLTPGARPEPSSLDEVLQKLETEPASQDMVSTETIPIEDQPFLPIPEISDSDPLAETNSESKQDNLL